MRARSVSHGGRCKVLICNSKCIVQDPVPGYAMKMCRPIMGGSPIGDNGISRGRLQGSFNALTTKSLPAGGKDYFGRIYAQE